MVSHVGVSPVFELLGTPDKWKSSMIPPFFDSLAAPPFHAWASTPGPVNACEVDVVYCAGEKGIGRTPAIICDHLLPLHPVSNATH